MNVKIKVNVADAVKVPKGISAEVSNSMDGTQGGEFDTMFKQWSKRYEAFVRRRFDRASKNDGTWAPLSQRTILARRSAKGGTRRQERARLRVQAKSAKTQEAADRISKKAKALRTMAGVSILRDTGALFAALTIGSAGNYLRRFRAGIRYGFANTKHPGRRGPSLAKIASFHDAGGGHLPQRRILADPDRQTVDGFVSDAKRAISSVIARIAARKGAK